MTEKPDIRIAPDFAAAGVAAALGWVTARVRVREADPDSAAALAGLARDLAEELGAGPGGALPVGALPVVAGTRAAFRALGKDPSRYRPSSEALLRRVAQGKPPFAVNSLVDANNPVLSSGIIDPIGSLVPFPRQAAVRRRCRRIVDAPPTHRGGGTSDPAGGPPRPLVVVAHSLRCASIAAAHAPSQEPRRAVEWGR